MILCVLSYTGNAQSWPWRCRRDETLWLLFWLCCRGRCSSLFGTRAPFLLCLLLKKVKLFNRLCSHHGYLEKRLIMLSTFISCLKCGSSKNSTIPRFVYLHSLSYPPTIIQLWAINHFQKVTRERMNIFANSPEPQPCQADRQQNKLQQNHVEEWIATPKQMLIEWWKAWGESTRLLCICMICPRCQTNQTLIICIFLFQILISSVASL